MLDVLANHYLPDLEFKPEALDELREMFKKHKTECYGLALTREENE